MMDDFLAKNFRFFSYSVYKFFDSKNIFELFYDLKDFKLFEPYVLPSEIHANLESYIINYPFSISKLHEELIALYDQRFIRIPIDIIKKVFDEYSLNEKFDPSDEVFCKKFEKLIDIILNKKYNYFQNDIYIYSHEAPNPELVLREEIMHHLTGSSTSLFNFINVLMWLNRIYRTFTIKYVLTTGCKLNKIIRKYFEHIILTYYWFLYVKEFLAETEEAFMRWIEISDSGKLNDSYAIQQVKEYHSNRGNLLEYLDFFIKISKAIIHNPTKYEKNDEEFHKESMWKLVTFILSPPVEKILLNKIDIKIHFYLLLDLFYKDPSNPKKILETIENNLSNTADRSFTTVVLQWIYRQGFPINLRTFIFLLKLVSSKMVFKTLLMPLTRNSSTHLVYSHPGLFSYEFKEGQLFLHICDPLTKYTISKVKTKGLESVVLDKTQDFYAKIFHFILIFILRIFPNFSSQSKSSDEFLDLNFFKFLISWSGIREHEDILKTIREFFFKTYEKLENIMEENNSLRIVVNEKNPLVIMDSFLHDRGKSLEEFINVTWSLFNWMVEQLENDDFLRERISLIIYPLYLHGIA